MCQQHEGIHKHQTRPDIHRLKGAANKALNLCFDSVFTPYSRTYPKAPKPYNSRIVLVELSMLYLIPIRLQVALDRKCKV